MKEFLKLGFLAAAASFIPGARASILILLVGDAYGNEAAATLGLSAQFLAITLVAVVGLSISTVFKFKTLTPPRTVSDVAQESGSIAFAGATLVFLVAILGGALIPLMSAGIVIAQFAPYWYISIISLLAAVFSSWQAGLLQARNADSRLFQINSVSAAVAVGLAVVITIFVPDEASLALACIAITNAVVDVVALVSRSKAVRTVWGTELAGLWKQSCRIFWSAKRITFQKLPAVSKATADGLILMLVFLTAGLVATRSDVGAGAAVLMAVALMRSLVLPLKQLGLVGGRLAMTAGRNRIHAVRPMILFVAALMALGAAALIVLKLLSLLPSHISMTLVYLLALQLLMEPITGFLFAAMKIMYKPDFAMKALLSISGLFTIPCILLLSLLDRATPELIWAVLLAARTVFGITVVNAVRRIQVFNEGRPAGLR